MFDLNGSTVLVTGAGSGLGRATARLFAQRGAWVVMTDLPTDAAAEAAAEIGATFVPADVTSRPEVEAAFDAAADLGAVRAVVHCAGRGGDRHRILDRDGAPSDLDSFLEVIRVNLGGSYNVVAVAASRMAGNEPVDGERGSIVLTASVAAFDGQIGQTAYASSKAAVHGMTLVAARDLSSRGIRVNTIAPGIFDTAMVAALREDVRADLAAAIPFPRRLGDPEEFAELALHLATNGYLNGETIRLDGSIRLAPR